MKSMVAKAGLVFLARVAPVCLLLVTAVSARPALAAGNSVVVVDGWTFDLGDHTSMVLDADGNPVVSYRDIGTNDLKLAHCLDPGCSNANIVTIPDTGPVGFFTSLKLDLAGNPIITYQGEGDVMLVHCNDPDCMGGDDPIHVIEDNDGWFPGWPDFPLPSYNSLELDAAGNPVIAYVFDAPPRVRLAHCSDPDCAGKVSIRTVDAAGAMEFTSLELDSVGNPVISYADSDNETLKLAHCNDPDCGGGGESIQTVDVTPIPGGFEMTSLELDAVGNPVISYYDAAHGDLKLAHCNDPNCVPGGDSIATVDSAVDVGPFSSLELDADGDPVISYRDATNGDLKVANCGAGPYNFNPNCDGGNVSIRTVDVAGNVGSHTALALDAGGKPVIAYFDASKRDLKLAHCGTVDCQEPVALPCGPSDCDYTLTVQGSGDGAGRMDDAAIDCSYVGAVSGDCSEQVSNPTTFAIVARPAVGSQLGGWTGCDTVSTTNVDGDTCQVDLHDYRAVTANFRR